MRTQIVGVREFNESDNNPDVRRMIVDEAWRNKAPQRQPWASAFSAGFASRRRNNSIVFFLIIAAMVDLDFRISARRRSTQTRRYPGRLGA